MPDAPGVWDSQRHTNISTATQSSESPIAVRCVSIRCRRKHGHCHSVTRSGDTRTNTYSRVNSVARQADTTEASEARVSILWPWSHALLAAVPSHDCVALVCPQPGHRIAALLVVLRPSRCSRESLAESHAVLATICTCRKKPRPCVALSALSHHHDNVLSWSRVESRCPHQASHSVARAPLMGSSAGRGQVDACSRAAMQPEKRVDEIRSLDRGCVGQSPNSKIR